MSGKTWWRWSVRARCRPRPRIGRGPLPPRSSSQRMPSTTCSISSTAPGRATTAASRSDGSTGPNITIRSATSSASTSSPPPTSPTTTSVTASTTSATSCRCRRCCWRDTCPPPRPSSTRRSSSATRPGRRRSGWAVSARRYGAGGHRRGGGVFLHAKGQISGQIYVDEGDYTIRVEVFGQQGGDEPVRGALRVSGDVLKEFELKATESEPATIEANVRLKAGSRTIASCLPEPLYRAPEARRSSPESPSPSLRRAIRAAAGRPGHASARAGRP